MNSQKIIEVVELYTAEIQTKTLPMAYKGELQHIAAMLPKIAEFAREGRLEKAFRWLGFVQGVFWVAGVYSIDEMRAHNMPANEEFQPRK